MILPQDIFVPNYMFVIRKTLCFFRANLFSVFRLKWGAQKNFSRVHSTCPFITAVFKPRSEGIPPSDFKNILSNIIDKTTYVIFENTP